jgi:hypothetical protein
VHLGLVPLLAHNADFFSEKTEKKAEEPIEEIPEVDEATVGQLDEEVRFVSSHCRRRLLMKT